MGRTHHESGLETGPTAPPDANSSPSRPREVEVDESSGAISGRRRREREGGVTSRRGLGSGEGSGGVELPSAAFFGAPEPSWGPEPSFGIVRRLRPGLDSGRSLFGSSGSRRISKRLISPRRRFIAGRSFPLRSASRPSILASLDSRVPRTPSPSIPERLVFPERPPPSNRHAPWARTREDSAEDSGNRSGERNRVSILTQRPRKTHSRANSSKAQRRSNRGC